MQKNKAKNLDRPYILHKNSGWIIDTNVNYKTIKLPQSNIRENLDNIGYDDTFLDSKWSMKEIIDKLDFIKIKNFCSAKDN